MSITLLQQTPCPYSSDREKGKDRVVPFALVIAFSVGIEQSGGLGLHDDHHGVRERPHMGAVPPLGG